MCGVGVGGGGGGVGEQVSMHDFCISPTCRPECHALMALQGMQPGHKL